MRIRREIFVFWYMDSYLCLLTCLAVAGKATLFVHTAYLLVSVISSSDGSLGCRLVFQWWSLILRAVGELANIFLPEDAVRY